MSPTGFRKSTEVNPCFTDFSPPSLNSFTRSSKTSEKITEINKNATGPLIPSFTSQGYTKILLDRDVDGEETEISKDAPCEESSGRPTHRFTGLILAILACVAFSLSSLIVKYLKDYHPFTKSVWRFQGIILPSLPAMIYSRCVKKERIFDPINPPCKNDNWKNVLYLSLRAFVGFTNIILQFYSLQYISLADQMVLGSSQPVFVVIVAYFMLGEKCGIVPFVTCIITIVGVFVVAKPPMFTGAESYDGDLLIGSSLAMASTLASTMVVVFMRRLKHIHVSLITFTFGSYSGILSLIGALCLGVLQFPQGQSHVLLAVLLASLVFVSQTCTTLALKYEQAGPVSLTRPCNIVFAFLWQYIFLSEVPDVFSVLGACIIALGVILTAIRKWVSTMPENSPGRRWFGFVLL